MNKDQSDPVEDPAVYNATVTHTGFPTGFTARHSPEEPKATLLETTQTRLVLIALSAASDEAGPQHLERVYGWPRWQPPQHPEASPHWKAIFHEDSRSWEGMICKPPGGRTQIVRAGSHAMKVTGPMWDMLQSTRTVVLCGGLRGDPTGQQLVAAMAQGRLHAVLAEALVA